MKEYDIQERGNKEFIVLFFFDKTSTVISSLFSILLLVVLFFKIKSSVIQNVWGYIVILIVLLFYLSFNKYIEWNRNKYNKLSIDSYDSLIINDKFYCKIEQIKSVNISYSVNQFESGWAIAIKRYLGSEEYVIKKRLKEEDAHIIAERIAAFLNKKIVVEN
jgi:hypothetical protein